MGVKIDPSTLWRGQPYETEADARYEPMVEEIRELHAARLVKAGDPDRLVRDTRYRFLCEVVAATGIEITDYELSQLRWLSEWDDTTIQVVGTLILRAHRAPVDDEVE